MSAYTCLVCTNFISSPLTRAYTAHSISMEGNTAALGILVSNMESVGPASAVTKPYCQPQIIAHSNTGMCMGQNINPPCGTAWNAIGKTMHSAENNAVSIRFLVVLFNLIFACFFGVSALSASARLTSEVTTQFSFFTTPRSDSRRMTV